MRFWFLAALLYGAAALAGTPRLQSLEARGFDVSHVDTHLTDDELEPLADVLDYVSTKLGPDWLPHPLHLWYSARTDFPHYVAKRPKVALRCENGDGKLLSVELSSRVIAHELGHAVFDARFARVSPPYANDLSRRVRYWDLMEELEAGKDVLDEFHDAATAGTEEEKAIFDRLLPYNELFADAFAVIYIGDPKALAAITANPEFRDFTGSLDLDRWKETEAYGIFAPARAMIWRSLSTIPPATVLDALIRAIDSEYRRTLPIANYLKQPENVKEANLDLIAAFRRELSSARR